MKKKILFNICLFFLSFSNVYASNSCSTDEKNRLLELANNVSINYEQVLEENDENDDIELDSYYKLRVHNLDKDLKLYLENDDNEFVLPTINKLEEEYFNNGEKLVFKIYSFSLNGCTNQLLRTITLDLPYYNEYYYFNKEKCQKYSEFKYCTEYLDKENDLDKEEIDNLFNEYIKENTSIVKSSSFYYILIAILLLMVIGIGVALYIKRLKKINKDL